MGLSNGLEDRLYPPLPLPSPSPPHPLSSRFSLPFLGGSGDGGVGTRGKRGEKCTGSGKREGGKQEQY